MDNNLDNVRRAQGINHCSEFVPPNDMNQQGRCIRKILEASIGCTCPKAESLAEIRHFCNLLVLVCVPGVTSPRTQLPVRNGMVLVFYFVTPSY